MSQKHFWGCKDMRFKLKTKGFREKRLFFSQGCVYIFLMRKLLHRRVRIFAINLELQR